MVIMHDIQKVCVFIYFVIVIYITTRGVGWMVKVSCGKEGEGSKPTWNNVVIITSSS
jgi:hypothetical protein